MEKVKGDSWLGTDGYKFADTGNKKQALLAAVRFEESPLEFEESLAKAKTTDEKIDALEKEIWSNINTPEDLKKVEYIALHVINLIYRESIANSQQPSKISQERIEKLKKISWRLRYEMCMIEDVENMQGQVDMTRKAYEENDKEDMEGFKTWPNFVIRTVRGYLENDYIDEKYRKKFLGIIDDANKCKEQWDI